MKLIKLTEEHYVIVDENKDINENDYTFKNGEIRQVSYLMQDNGNVITHSTNINFNEVYYIPLQEVKELIGEVDVDKLAEKEANELSSILDPNGSGYSDYVEGFKKGYNQALEDNKEKKYTEEDIIQAILKTIDACNEAQKDSYGELEIDEEKIIQSLQPKTEWEVEIVDGKLKLV